MVGAIGFESALQQQTKNLMEHSWQSQASQVCDERQTDFRNHPKWGDCLITSLQARPVEIWLESLLLAPKSKVHIRGILNALWNYAMWKQDVPMQVNPISLVTIKGASKRVRQPRSLTVEQFRLLVSYLREPFGTMALLCVCFGLRISECLALRWSDVDWLNGTLRVERGIVEQNVDDVKSDESRK